MNWKSIGESWNALRGRVTTRRGTTNEDGVSGKSGFRRNGYLHEHCQVSRDEANRRMRDWIKDPGVLDDWNDTRSILDM
jgi:hypothetical protein